MSGGLGVALWRRGDCRRRERGAVAVEFALVLPILVMLLLGTVSAGLAYAHSLGLASAVREGSRFAATAQYPAVSGDWALDVATRTHDLQFDDPSFATKICVDLQQKTSSGTTSHVSTCPQPGSGDAATRTPPAFSMPPNTPDDTCIVRVWAARDFEINAIFVRFPARAMVRQSVAVYERKPCVAPPTP